ncbi:aminotransferase class I/II-fold pyridoxal phosphate-dependent enzyme [Tropicimonas sp. S265A]|uniref:aminotransferase class I/II-fold pyridoxal phosphate-dependent enzyme n=1 Tax=Tropicimonas sp. S265A TaxID=3415134 RepID=UPI003C79B8AD
MRNSSRSDIDPFIVMDVMEAARAAEATGQSVIHMEVGQPGTPAPAAARTALARALDTPLGYTVALGVPELREGIARLYQRWYGIDLNPDRVVVTAGSSAAFLLAFTALFDAGERVGVAEPGYPSYRQILRALSLEPVGLPTHAAEGHRLQPDAVRAADIAGAIVASPNNPTGTMLGHEGLAGLVEACQSQGRAFISDEIYHGLHYGARAVSALEVSDEVYVINSFSKYFSMTGWRLGWMVVPQDHVRRIERLAQNMFICAPHAAQIAAIGALSGEAEAELEGNRAVYAENRRIVTEALTAMGLTHFAPPDGAFYVYVDVSHLSSDTLALSREILSTAGVAVTPGLDFDALRGGGMLRLSYARATRDVAEGMSRLAVFFNARQPLRA